MKSRPRRPNIQLAGARPVCQDLRIFDRTLFLETIVTTVLIPSVLWKFTVKFHTTFIVLMLCKMGVQAGTQKVKVLNVIRFEIREIVTKDVENPRFLVATLRQGIPMVQRAVGVPEGM